MLRGGIHPDRAEDVAELLRVDHPALVHVEELVLQLKVAEARLAHLLLQGGVDLFARGAEGGRREGARGIERQRGARRRARTSEARGGRDARGTRALSRA